MKKKKSHKFLYLIIMIMKKREKLDKVVDDLKQKYGYNSITRAGKLHSEDKIKLKDI